MADAKTTTTCHAYYDSIGEDVFVYFESQMDYEQYEEVQYLGSFEAIPAPVNEPREHVAVSITCLDILMVVGIGQHNPNRWMMVWELNDGFLVSPSQADGDTKQRPPSEV